MTKKKTEKKTKFIFNYKINEIKKQNLFFAITYFQIGDNAQFTDLLHWSEITNVNYKELKVLRIDILKKGIIVKKLYQYRIMKLLNILDLYNNKGLELSEIPQTSAPTDKEIIFCISLYFSIDEKFTRKNLLFKYYLNEVAKQNRFIDKITNQTEKVIFKTYLTTEISKVNISRDQLAVTNSGVYLINKNLKILVSEIMQQYEKGHLKIKEHMKQPIRKTKKQFLKEWENFSNEFNHSENEQKKR